VTAIATGVQVGLFRSVESGLPMDEVKIAKLKLFFLTRVNTILTFYGLLKNNYCYFLTVF